jgi:hypothetical protein
VHEDQVALGPVVTLVVMDLVAAALEDEEGGLVLVAVAAVGRAGRQLDEVDLESLGEEGVVAGGDPPPCPGLIGVSGMRYLGVIDDHGVIAYSRGG